MGKVAGLKIPKLKQRKERFSVKTLTVDDVRKLRMKEALIEDEKTIHQLEKQLKFRNRKKKIPKSFYDEGLGYLLEVIDQRKENFSEKKDIYNNLTKIKKKSKTRRPTSENIRNNTGSDSSEVTETMSCIVNDNPQIAKHGAIDKNENGSSDDERCDNYINDDPPTEQIDQIIVRKQKPFKPIHRLLKGLLNRLSETNIQSIASQIEEIYSKHSRNDVNETLSSLMLDSIVLPTQTPERLIMEHAMLIALLHANVGEEIGAHFLQVIICKLEELFNDCKYYGEGKMCDNAICLISHIYAFKVTSSILMYDILHKLYTGFQEKDIELILLILRNVGFALRKDDPIALRQLILDIQKKTAEQSPEQDQTRVRFMLETLTAIRNNNMYKIRNYDPSLSEHMRKLLKSFIHKGHYIQEMRISYNDFLNADKGGGRWWIIGSAWNKEKTDQDVSPTTHISMGGVEYSEDLLRLAKTYRMNTEIRKNIFCIIASAEDYLDAFNRLMHIGLKSVQYREIVIVILDCCLQECTFNPYYAVLIEKFCKFDRKYRMGFQCAVWDKIKYVNEILQSQRKNLADLLVYSLVSGALNITVLKVISFADLEVKMVKFLQRIFRKLLLLHSEEECQKIFKKIPKDEKTFKESIRLFIIMFLDDKKDILQSKLALLCPRNKKL